MRQFLVDDARRRGRHKRGGGRARVDTRKSAANLGETAAAPEHDLARSLAVYETLAELQVLDERKAVIVQTRFFEGLSVDETAKKLGLSPRQIEKEWRFTHAWLLSKLS
jgi:RNA polymerase sigma factor (sigma-70 family)